MSDGKEGHANEFQRLVRTRKAKLEGEASQVERKQKPRVEVRKEILKE